MLKLSEENMSIVNCAWDNYKLVVNMLSALENIGLIVEPNTIESFNSLGNLYKIADNSCKIIASILHIPKSKGEEFITILNDAVEEDSNSERISDDVINKLINLQ